MAERRALSTLSGCPASGPKTAVWPCAYSVLSLVTCEPSLGTESGMFKVLYMYGCSANSAMTFEISLIVKHFCHQDVLDGWSRRHC